MRPGTANRVGGRKRSGTVPGISVSVTGVPLLLPGIAARVVAVALPEARLLVVQDPQARDPLDALPEVQVRHHQPGRAAVFARQRFAVVVPDDPGPPA